MLGEVFVNIRAVVESQYEAATASQAALHFDSTVTAVEELNIPLELRCVPALAHKPDGDKGTTDSESSTKESRPDPFAPPYNKDLFIAEDAVVGEGGITEAEEFILVLNKYCVVPRHLILATKDFIPQTTPLSPYELWAAFSLLKQFSAREKHLAFFNCGPTSGASQPHKHLQLLPLAETGAPIDAFLVETKPPNTHGPYQLPLPYANFVSLLTPPTNNEAASTYLAGVYLSLLDLLIDHLRELAAHPDFAFPGMTMATVSYNFLMTERWMMLVPRAASEVTIDGEEGKKHTISINSLGFAGMVLVKSEEDLAAVKKDGVLKLLAAAGFPAVIPDVAPPEAQPEAAEDSKQDEPVL